MLTAPRPGERRSVSYHALASRTAVSSSSFDLPMALVDGGVTLTMEWGARRSTARSPPGSSGALQKLLN